MTDRYDVVVVGAGNAAFCAALAAREQGATVLVLERAPEDEAGGNSRFTAGLMRVAYNGVEDLKRVMPDLSADEIARTDFVHLHRGPVEKSFGEDRSSQSRLIRRATNSRGTPES